MAMCNKFITFLVLTFMVSISFAQQYTPMTAAGYQYKRAKVDSTLHIPSFCGVPTLRNSTAIQGAIAMDTCANKLYQWTNAAGWSIISGSGGGGGTLQSVTDSGNTTTNDIQLLNHARVILGDSGEVLLDNGSKLKMGAIDAQTGGSKGIALICAVGYEMKWEGGSLYIMNDQGLTVREVRYKFSSIPTTTDDGSKGFYPGSRWVLDNGQLYVCSDSTSGAAVWQNSTYPSLQDVATVGNFYVNDNVDTLRLNSYDANIKHPILWTNDFYGGTPNNILDFSYGPSTYENVAKIKFGNASNTLGEGYIEITDKQSYFKNEFSQRTIIQNAPSTYSTIQTTYFPLMKGSIDTLATTEDIRNSATGGTITSIATGYGLSGGTITTSGTLLADTSVSGLSGKYLRLTDTATMLSNYVPYTGATGNVNLGLNTLYAESLQAKSSVYVRDETANKNYLVMSNASNKGNVNFANQNLGQLGNVSLTVNPLSDSRSINLPDSSGTIALKDYTVNSISRTLGKDSIIFYIGSTRYAIKDSVGTNPAPVGYYGAFADTLTQTIASTTVAYPMNFRVTDLSNGVSVVNNNRVLFANAGVYNLQFSAQLTNSSTSTEVGVSIWIRKNGVDVSGSTGYIQLPKKGSGLNGETLPSWNFVLSLAAGDSIVWYWRADNTAASITSFAAGTSPTRPSTASTILTVTQQSGIMAGTGITGLGTSGNAQTGATQVLATGTSGTDFAISSSSNTHTFNLPTASATNRGALSSANWSTFNSKLGASDTVSLSNRINLKVNIADTSSMLTPYLRKIDTASLSLRINLKVNISDTASMLTPYLRKIDTTNRFVNNISRTVGKDSIIFNIGSTRYAIKDSVGGGSTASEWDIATAFQGLGSTFKGINLTNPNFYITEGSIGANGLMYGLAYYLPTAQTITGVKWYQNTNGNYTASNYNGVGLYTYSGGTLTLVASTTNDGNIWQPGSTGWKSKSFSSSYNAAAGNYYICFIYSRSAQSTAPSIGSCPSPVTASMQYDFTNNARLNFQYPGSQSSLPSPITLGTSFNSNINWGFYLY